MLLKLWAKTLLNYQEIFQNITFMRQSLTVEHPCLLKINLSSHTL